MAEIIKGRVDILLISCSSKFLLKRSIDSIKNQLFRNWRLLIVNDNSNDNEVSKYLEDLILCDENVKVFTNSARLGLTKSLINLFPFIKSEYIARIDSGDTWDRDKLYKQVNYLEENQNIGLIGSQVRFVLKNNDTIRHSSFPSSFKVIKDNCCMNIGLFCHSSIIFRYRNNLFYRELYYYSQDLDLYLQHISNDIEIINYKERLCSILFISNSISVRKKPLQLKCISRAIKNYKLRKNNLPEDNSKIKINFLESLLWRLARPFYLKYIVFSSKRKILARIYLLITIIFYPPLLSLYKPRLINKLKLIKGL